MKDCSGAKKTRCKVKFFPLLCVSLLVFVYPAYAQNSAEYNSTNNRNVPELGSHSAVVMDATTGTIVFEKNPDDEIPPASLTKLMTMHLALKEADAGRASLEEIISPSKESWAVNQLPRSSLMNLANGQILSLRELLLGMAIFSGNDAATAVALRFAPSIEEFAEIMTSEAASLGLHKTRFVDPSGYSEENMTTAREFTEFCRIYLKTHPETINDYHSVKEFAYPRPENWPDRENLRTRIQPNHNRLLETVEGVDGLKTGYIPESGYNIALTAERNGSRFIAVILGAPSEWRGDRIRDQDGENLINWVFDNYKTIRFYTDPLNPLRIWKGKSNYVEIIPSLPLEFTAVTERGHDLSLQMITQKTLIAPLPAGSHVGDMVLYDSFGELRRIPMVTVQEIETGGFFKRLIDSIKLFFMGLRQSFHS